MKTGGWSGSAAADAAPIVWVAGGVESAEPAGEQASVIGRARAFAQPMLEGERFDTGEDALAHADGVAAILGAIGAAPSLRAAAYLVYAGDYLTRPEDVIGKAFGAGYAGLVEHTRKLVQIQRYHTEVFAKFIDRLAKAKESDGTVLDHSTILFGSNMINSDRHNNDPLPAALLGHAHGRIKGGQHLKYPQDSRFADLLVTLFDRNNIPIEKIGDSGGTVSEV